ncbi:hypothetical protein JWV37_02525 [Sulfurospirillum sp. T05]|uniref:Uncharacterized protein n=1 Tax=Sulfurospirillum tamanense TaxID=2813362 RepID=A0ABS2WPK9_9BACT|nr:hypothetical protein [Sulfurospirillum tamanensis]MBN2963642.1 hypothetical protein [Sulfurospirillum tamanensis]
MNHIVNALLSKGVVCRSLTPVSLRELDSRKRLECYVGVGLDARYICVWMRESKTKILSAEAAQLEALVARLEVLRNHRVFVKILLTNAPVCSKTQTLMQKNGWRIWRVPV